MMNDELLETTPMDFNALIHRTYEVGTIVEKKFKAYANCTTYSFDVRVMTKFGPEVLNFVSHSFDSLMRKRDEVLRVFCRKTNIPAEIIVDNQQ